MGCQGLSSGTGASPDYVTRGRGPRIPLRLAVLTANLSSLSFASVQVGDSRTLSEALTNTGRADITISQAAISGAGFRMSGFNPPTTLTPGQTRTFSVVFAPQSTQNASGSISFVSNASNSNLTISISGTGTAPGQLAVSPTNLSFGSVVDGTSVSLPASLSAKGSSVTVNSANVSTSGFTLGGLSFPITIAAGQSASFTVTFTPESSGVANAALSFESNATKSPTVESLTGTGTTSAGSGYNARTDLISQPYPNPIPCPSESGCSSGGALTGANYWFTPSDFPTTPIVRVTDGGIPAAQSPQHQANTSCDAGSEVNDWNMNDDRFTICGIPQHQILYGFNTATNQVTLDTTFALINTTSAYFSYTQPYIMYHGHQCGSGVSGCPEYDLGIFSYDTTCSGGIATCNPSPVLVVDVSTACSISALQRNPNSEFSEGITVSGDDQTFSGPASSTVGQGSTGDAYAITWNRNNGCSYWNTSTGQVYTNGTLVGTIGIPDRFTIHNSRIGKGGQELKVEGTVGTCGGTCPGLQSATDKYFWTIGTTAVTYTTSGN